MDWESAQGKSDNSRNAVIGKEEGSSLSLFACVDLDGLQDAAHFAKCDDEQADEGGRQSHRRKHRRNLRHWVMIALPYDTAEPQHSSYREDDSSSLKNTCHRPLPSKLPRDVSMD